MLRHRAILVAMATFFTAGMTSIASAGCCGWGVSAPIAYAPVTYVQPIVASPVAYGGCGTCGYSSAAAVFAEPVAPAAYSVGNWGGGWGGGWAGSWGNGCGGCGRGLIYAAPAVYAAPAASLYVVNQGPEYSGPGIMNPYRTYSPASAYAPADDYPYVPGYGSHYGYGAHYGYGSGYGYGSHYGYGPRYGYGSGYGYGSHYGYGAHYGYGPRYGYRSGYGYGAHYGYGSHYGYGAPRVSFYGGRFYGHPHMSTPMPRMRPY
jgi:hypothetical protein